MVNKVRKRDGRIVDFDFNKIVEAVKKAFESQKSECDKQFFDALRNNLAHFDDDATISIEKIQDEVEKTLIGCGYNKIARAYILYREQHTESRFIKERIDYMDRYSQSGNNAATSSETDSNANVTMKNVANLEGEVYKTTNRIIQRQRMKSELNKLFPEVAKQYEKDLNHHIIYCHDEASTPVLKQYTYSPYETVEVKYGDLHLLTSLQSLYNEVQCMEVLEDEKVGVWCKYPSNLFVKDRTGWTRITRLTKKKRHRDLVRVKTAFGEDIVVTDNHPMIIADDKTSTKQAIDVAGEKQLRLDNSITFDGIEVLDLASCVECDGVYSNFITSHESKFTPYFYSKRFVKIDRALGYVVGFFIGDGNYDNTFGTLSFAQKEKETLDKLAEMLFESFGVVSYANQNGGSNPEIWHMKVCSRIVAQVFRNFFKIKDKAENKCLPYNLLMFNEGFAKGIVEGLIDSDGTVQSNNSTIQIRLSSRECITQLTKLLRHFGYGVGNSYQQTPFGNNVKIRTNYDLWGVLFTKTSKAVSFDWSYKFQKNVTNNIDKGLKYSVGWTTVTNVQKIENGSFLNKCNYIYDITTETNTFDCNNLWVHNCMAVSLYPLISEGVGNIDGVTPSAPNDLQSFSGQITNLVFLLSSQCKGAVAISEYFIALNYYVVKEFGEKWYDYLDAPTTTDYCAIRRTVRDNILKAFKQFVWGINQPAGNRSYQSPFTNISYYDKTYFDSLFGEFYYPDGSKPEWKAIDTLQRMFMKWFNRIRLKQVLTFPVETFAMVHDGKDIVDKDYKELCAEMYAEGHSFFTYISESADSLASCCRLRNELAENTFNPTSGLTGVMTGSCNVITLNISRIVQDAIREYAKEHGEDTSKYQCWSIDAKDAITDTLLDILDRVYKYHIAFKTMLYDMEDKKMFAASNGGYIYINKLYSTIGINGLNEAARFLGLGVSNNPEYIEFLQLILGTIKEQNKLHSIRDKKRPFLFNSEVVPAEGLGSKNYEWDKADGYWVPDDENLYNSYFYEAHDNTSVLDKFVLHGNQTYQYTDGGSAAHINLEEHLSKVQYLKLIDFAIDNGTSYFTFNIPNSKCESCGKIVKQPINKCPCCGSEDITQYTRIIGYLRPIKNFGIERQIEAGKRVYSKGL